MLQSSSISDNPDLEKILLLCTPSGFKSSPSDILGNWFYPEVIYQTAITIDLETEIVKKTIVDLSNSASLISFKLTEIQKIKQLMDKINALEEVAGLINDLSPERMETFEESIKRRVLFK